MERIWRRSTTTVLIVVASLKVQTVVGGLSLPDMGACHAGSLHISKNISSWRMKAVNFRSEFFVLLVPVLVWVDP